ncbi:hypothetical protein HDU93_000431 [Gonapodya sp. JEL0774]|nr:hypothetical protein HDU93_000431 [Gonapodya sp. JEL0774]
MNYAEISAIPTLPMLDPTSVPTTTTSPLLPLPPPPPAPGGEKVGGGGCGGGGGGSGVGEVVGGNGLMPPLPRARSCFQLPPATPTTTVATITTTPIHYPNGMLKHSHDRISCTTSGKRPQGAQSTHASRQPTWVGDCGQADVPAGAPGDPVRKSGTLGEGESGVGWDGVVQRDRWAGGGEDRTVRTGGVGEEGSVGWGDRSGGESSNPYLHRYRAAPSWPARSTAPSSPAKSLASPTQTLQSKFPAVLKRLIGGGGTGEKHEREGSLTCEWTAARGVQKQASMSAGTKASLAKCGPPAACTAGKKLSIVEASEEGVEGDEEDGETDEESEGSSGSGGKETDD